MPTSRCLTRSACAHADAVLRLRDDIGDDAQWLAALGAALLLERLGLEETDGERKEETDGALSKKNDGNDKYARLSGYVASLPVREPNVVASWPETRRRFLAGTDVERALRCERAAAKNEWEQFVERRVREEVALRDEELAASSAKIKRKKNRLTFEAYLDARSVVSSRAFHVTDEVGPGLVPIADLFNHRTGGNHVAMRLIDEEEKSSSGSSEKKKVATKLAATVVARVAKGEEVFNTYGLLGNASLLNSYGFTQEHNPADTVSVSVPDLRAAAAMRGAPGRVVSKRLAACFEKKSLAPFQEHSLFPLRRVEAGSEARPPTALLVALWAVTATDEAFAKAEREIDQSLMGVHDFGDREEEEDAEDDSRASSTWRAAAERADVSGSIVTAAASEVFLEILDRRRRMYVDVPADFREDEPSTSDAESESAGWRACLRILVESERAIVDAHAATTERRLAATRGGELAEKDDDAKRREKIQNASVAEAADAFALFD